MKMKIKMKAQRGYGLQAKGWRLFVYDYVYVYEIRQVEGFYRRNTKCAEGMAATERGPTISFNDVLELQNGPGTG